MSGFVTYTAVEGDRWDLIAYKAYGSVSKMNLIIDANPYVSLTPTIPEGTKISIPVLEEDVADTSLLPPWKQ